MKQREVQDNDKIIWTCVQVFSGTNGEAAKVAQAKTENDGFVEVVCTPSGGAQTKRIQLPSDWGETMTDGELITKIER